MKTKLFLLTLVSVGIVCAGKKACLIYRKCQCEKSIRKDRFQTAQHCIDCGGV